MTKNLIHRIIVPIIALALISVSCSKEDGPTPEEPHTISIEALLPPPAVEDSTNIPGTKARFVVTDSLSKTVWEEGDEICVFNEKGDGKGQGAVSYRLKLVEGAGTDKGTFCCDSFAGTPTAAVYPYSQALDCNKTATGLIRYKVPEATKLGESYREPVVMLGNINDGKTINFSNVSAYFRFTVTEIPSNITSMTYSADEISAGYGVSGEFGIKLSEIGKSCPENTATPGATFTVNFSAGTKEAVFLVPVATGQRKPSRIWFNDEAGKVEGSERQLNNGKEYTAENQLNGTVHNVKPYSLKEWIEKDDLFIKFTGIWEDLVVGETSQIGYELYGPAYDPSKTYKVTCKSSDESVLELNKNGVLTAKANGRATVTATVEGGKNTAEREYVVTDYSCLTGPYSEDLKFRTGYQYKSPTNVRVLHSNSVIQSWDWNDVNTYFTQLNGGYSSLAMSRCNVLATKSAKFLLHFAGHGDTICKEMTDDGTTWIWVSSYATIDESKTSREEGKIYYINNQTVSRIPASTFKDGDIFDPWDFTEHYLYQTADQYLYNLQVAIDTDNNLIALWGLDPAAPEGSHIKLKVYKFDEVKALPKTTVTLKPITYGGYTESATGKVYPEKTETFTIQAYNLASLTPVRDITVPLHVSWVHYPQGFEYHHNKLYYNYGGGSTTAGGNTHRLVIIDPDTATIIDQKSVPWINDSSVTGEFATTGYFEPEGVKIRDGYIYLGWAGRGTTKPSNASIRCGHIFRFKM